MKIPNQLRNNLSIKMFETLTFIRKYRGMNPQQYLEAKHLIIGSYLSKNKLDACVIGISGGIDSAVTLGILKSFHSKHPSILKKIIAISLPNFDPKAASNQKESIIKCRELSTQLEIPIHIIDTTESYNNIYSQLTNSLDITNEDNWAKGQLVSYNRTPYLYFSTSLLTSQGFNPFVAGTTNRDEGSYLGYVGKASDGMVDIQIISDLHKSEIFKLAEFLNIPQSILQAKPSGDMYDKRTDEDIFGAPYDFVELYLNLSSVSTETWTNLVSEWTEDDFLCYKTMSTSINNLHLYNSHKYQVGSPAVHLDILPSAFHNGWIEGIHSNLFKKLPTPTPSTHNFVGYVEPPPHLSISNLHLITNNKKQLFTHTSSLITNKEADIIINWADMHYQKMIETDKYGKPCHFGINKKSKRLSFYSTEFARILSERLLFSQSINHFEIFNHFSNTNWHPDKLWRFTHINPMFRLIKYQENDFLLPHYDDSFSLSSKQKSLISLIIYLNSNYSGGETRFINDEQIKINFSDRDFSDKPNQPKESDILFSIKPNQGDAILFEHRNLHDSNTITKGTKFILRTELMYESCIL